MSYSEAITRNDLTEILTQLGIGVSFGQMYHADWTATSSSSTPYQVTGSITLSKGKYLAIISIPVCSQETVLYFYLHSLGAQKSIVHGFSQGKHPVLFELTETTTIWVEAGMSQSTTYSYLERGGLDVICLSDLKQYGTTVLDYYPVGSYYETSDASFDPNTAWGGTWSKETVFGDGKLLFNNDSAEISQTSVTLSESVENYGSVTVCYKDNDNKYDSVDISNPVNKTFGLIASWGAGANYLYYKTGLWRIGTTTLTKGWEYEYGITTTPNVTRTEKNAFAITQVIGYRTMYRWHRTA